MGITLRGPSTEEVCNCLNISIAKNNVGHLLVVVCVNETSLYPPPCWINATETSFKREKEKIFCTL